MYTCTFTKCKHQLYAGLIFSVLVNTDVAVQSWWKYLLTWSNKHGLFFFAVTIAGIFIPAVDAIHDLVAAVADAYALPRIRTASHVNCNKNNTHWSYMRLLLQALLRCCKCTIGTLLRLAGVELFVGAVVAVHQAVAHFENMNRAVVIECNEIPLWLRITNFTDVCTNIVAIIKLICNKT